MKLIDKDALVAEIEKLKSNLIYGACSSQIAMKTMCKEEAYNEILAILDSMREEPVSDDLTDKAKTSSGWDGFFYGQGYKQAEKDLELTWEDVRRIYLIVNSTINDVGMDSLTDKSIYQEILKRFKDLKK